METRLEQKYIVEDNSSFELKNRKYSSQYASMYAHRAKVLGNLFGNNNNESTCLVGVLVKCMAKLPSILDKSDDKKKKIKNENGTYISEDDYLIIENEHERIRLAGATEVLPVQKLSSGMVAAVEGKRADGAFHVTKIRLPGLAPQFSIPQKKEISQYILFASNMIQDTSLLLHLLADFVSGQLDNRKSSNTPIPSSSIVRVVLAGPIHQKFHDLGEDKIVQCIREIDTALSQLASSVAVDVLPGESDASNHSLPQQPFHKSLFPMASKYSSFHCNSNPCWLQESGTRMLATSGQNIQDLSLTCQGSVLELMERTLRCRHLAPTAPDTLATFAYDNFDPFVLETCPHLYVCGNQKQFATKLLKEGNKQCRLISLPCFSQTGEVVLVNVSSLETKRLQFQIFQ